MRTTYWTAGLLAIGLVAVAACSSDNETTAPAPTTTTTSTTTTFTNTTSTTSTTTTTSSCVSDLEGSLGYPAGCDACVEDSCCPEAAALTASGSEADLLALWACERDSGNQCTPDCDASICDYSFIRFPDCNGCTACLEQNCCDSYMPCVTDGTCQDCILFASFEPESCCDGANELFTPFDNCRATECPQCLGCVYGNTCGGTGGGGGNAGGSGGGNAGGSGGSGGNG